MTNSLDERAAKIMGIVVWDADIKSGQIYRSGRDQVIWISSGLGVVHDPSFSPSTRWDHAGILIEWASDRAGAEFYWRYDDCLWDLTPAHITEAFVKVFEKGNENG